MKCIRCCYFEREKLVLNKINVLLENVGNNNSEIRLEKKIFAPKNPMFRLSGGGERDTHSRESPLPLPQWSKSTSHSSLEILEILG